MRFTTQTWVFVRLIVVLPTIVALATRDSVAGAEHAESHEVILKTSPAIAGQPVSMMSLRLALSLNNETEKAFWDSVNKNDLAELEAYLKTFPDGRYKGQAKARLEALQQQREATEELKRRQQLVKPSPAEIEQILGLSRAKRRELQQALKILDYDPGAIDGNFGPNTRLAISAFQRAQGYGVTGYLTDYQVQALLAESEAQRKALARQEEQTGREERPQPTQRTPGQVFQDRLGDGTQGPEMVVIPGGSFWMGSPESEDGRLDDERRHRMEVAREFAIGKYEVTAGQFRRFVEATGYRTEAEKGSGCWYWDGEWKEDVSKTWQNPGFSQTDTHPVVCVSWNDAVAYTEWLSRQTGEQYRLPTEAEWEYAARAGTQTARFWGDDANQGCRYANAADLTAKGRFSGRIIMDCRDGYLYAAPVGRFQANAFGLWDVLGNVWEWTCSEYDEGYNGKEKRCLRNNRANAQRVIRGGSWYNWPPWVRSAYRYWSLPDVRYCNMGFRLARRL